MGIHFYKRINPSICPSQSYLVFELIVVFVFIFCTSVWYLDGAIKKDAWI